MTDKQLIIDGVDVSGCEHFNDSGNYNCRGCRRCNDNPNCYYKQLKRKEQECEELKNFHINLVGVKECEIKELAELKADNKHLNGLLNQALKELEEHREAFEKVRELIQKEIADCEHCDDCTNCEYNCCTRQILQICDEVKE